MYMIELAHYDCVTVTLHDVPSDIDNDDDALDYALVMLYEHDARSVLLLDVLNGVVVGMMRR